MPWFKVDDAFHAHPKAIAAGTAALGLWVRCGSWSAQQLTDGFVPAAVANLYGTRACARALVAAGLWLEADGGYQFHDWADKNPLREDVEANREQKRAAGRVGGKASGKSRAQSKQEPSTSEAERLPSGSELPNTRPDPSQPDQLPAPTVLTARSETQRSKALTDAYSSLEPMCKWPAVNGVILKAIRSGRFRDDEIHDALQRLAKEGRSVTVDSLRYELQGMPTGRASPRGSNMSDHAAVIRQLEQGESA
jgi:hypothetical protein